VLAKHHRAKVEAMLTDDQKKELQEEKKAVRKSWQATQ
jgi:hypothetical protein